LQTLSVTEEINDDRVSQSGNEMPTDNVTGLHNVSGTVCTDGKTNIVIYFLCLSVEHHCSSTVGPSLSMIRLCNLDINCSACLKEGDH
jgi:hypothetical protein